MTTSTLTYSRASLGCGLSTAFGTFAKLACAAGVVFFFYRIATTVAAFSA